MNTRPIVPVHLSDLHFGAPGKEVLNQAIAEFFQALREQNHPHRARSHPGFGRRGVFGQTGGIRSGPMDFSPTCAARSQKSTTRVYPLLLCVPGNHDLIRPKNGDALTYDVFNRYSESSDDDGSVRTLNEMLSGKSDAKLLTPLFSGYLEWWNKRLEELRGRPGVTVHTSHIPGDVCVDLALDDPFPLCIVGLNSAWVAIQRLRLRKKALTSYPPVSSSFATCRNFEPSGYLQAVSQSAADVAPSPFVVVPHSTEYVLL